MAVERKLIRRETYREHTIEARYLGPDLLAYVAEAGGTSVQLNCFYIDAQSAIRGGQRFVDEQIKAREKK